MDILVTVDDVKSRMALPDTIDVDDFVNSGLGASQLHMASILDTDLQEADGLVDRFFLDSRANMGVQRQGMFRCRLSHGFVRIDTPPVVTIQTSWNNADASAIAIDPTLMLFTADGMEKGILQVDKSLAGKWLVVTYSAGFTVNDELPDWLKESILSYAPMVFNWGATTNRDADAKQGYATAGDHAIAVVSKHIRSRVATLSPL